MKYEHWHKVIDICDYCNITFIELKKSHQRIVRMPISLKSARLSIFIYLKRHNISYSILRHDLNCYFSNYQLNRNYYLIEGSTGLKRLIGL